MKKQLRFLACLTAALSLGSLTACSFAGGLAGVMKGDGNSESWYPNGSESASGGSWEQESASEKDPEPEDPNPEKVVAYTTTDDIGHKVVYYTDGTYDDLGRDTAYPLDFSSPAPEFQYGYQSFAAEAKGKGLCGYYKAIAEVAKNFHNSTATLSPDKDGDYVLSEINYSDFGLTQEEALAVWKVFGDENPLYYWLSGELYVNETEGSLILLVDSAYVSYTVRAQANEKIRAMARDCDRYLSGLTTRTERAVTIFDYIASAIDYAYEADGVTAVEETWAYNIAGAATYGYGVCEAYAELYAYFCGMFGLECLNVVGVAGTEGEKSSWGGHAWNYLCLEDKWFAVDITWADQENFLLREYFGQDLASYNATHAVDLPTSDWGTGYQCALPTLSGGLCPVVVGEVGGEKLMVYSLDEAAHRMTYSGTSYEVTLYPHTSVTKAKDIFVYPYGAKFMTTTKLPEAEHITFTSDTDPAYEAEIETVNTLTLQSDITMKGLTYDPLKWNKNGYAILKG